MRSGSFGFVQTAEGEFFVPASALGGAFDGDLVELAPLSTGGKKRKAAAGASGFGADCAGAPAARVLRVLDRAHDVVVGRYEVADPFGVVVPEDKRIPYDIFTMRADYPDIEHGSLVRVRVTQFPTRHTAATGVVEEVLGVAGEGALGVDLIVARHKLETEFSAYALDQARAATLDVEGALSAGYADLRERFVFTIDPDDARDFDDALSLERASELPRADAIPRGAVWRLGVHIADVSHYVPWDSSLDVDARRRATSVYLVDRVIPMLPEELSCDLCSLVPGQARRSMTVDLYLDARARVTGYDIYPALICSNARLTYDEAFEMLGGASVPDEADALDCASRATPGRDVCGKPDVDDLDACEASTRGERLGMAEDASALVDAWDGAEDGAEVDARDVTWRLRECSHIAKLRAASREQAGGIDFATTEAKVRLDADGNAEDIVLRVKNDATELVEEAMILANETVAAHLQAKGFPCAYRIHESPDPDALGGLVAVFCEFPWFTDSMRARLATGDPHVIQQILEASRGRAEGELVSSLLLRSMKRALYRPENVGHYGLASRAYCHFTSPIRRYPDLVVHRMLRACACGRPEKFDQEVAALPWICEHASDMERIADAAARESQELKMVEYLERFVGQAFSGVVSGVASYGLYVRLDCTAEGLLPVRALGAEYFFFDPVRYVLTGEDTGKAYRLGQRVAVTLKVAEPQTARLEFSLATGGRAQARA